MDIVHLSSIGNSIIRTRCYPAQWKVEQVIIISKPGKALDEMNSYRPLSLMPMMSKSFEKAMLKRLHQILEENRIFPDQFRFRQQHFTIEKVLTIAR
jgi:hypothetical protein